MAEESGLVAFDIYCESCSYRLVVCHTFRISALSDTKDLLRQFHFLLFHNLEVADYVDCSFRSKEGKFVELIVLKEHICYLDDSLLSVLLAVKVNADSDLVLDSFEIEDVESLIYILRRNVVQYGTVFQCAYY